MYIPIYIYRDSRDENIINCMHHHQLWPAETVIEDPNSKFVVIDAIKAMRSIMDRKKSCNHNDAVLDDRQSVIIESDVNASHTSMKSMIDKQNIVPTSTISNEKYHHHVLLDD